LTDISQQLLKQRIRENIIDYLELASSSLEQREYERSLVEAKAPGIVPVEVVSQWEDSVRPSDFDWFDEPVFSEQEASAIRRFHKIWDEVVEVLPEPMPWSIEQVLDSEPWKKLIIGASEALTIFMLRGRFSRDTEQPF
jgi:hypothetical protein